MSSTTDAALGRSLFVIPSINGGRLLARMLPTLNMPLANVVVLDQGSIDDTAEVCARHGAELRQLGTPHTYTQACNIGADLARDRGCDFLFVANNDITFVTDVARELLAEMLADPGLGIVAPSQVISNDARTQQRLAYRAGWSLDRLHFQHDFEEPPGDPARLESDFCELTLAAIRMSAIAEIGFLDNDYGFYHEDADFGFRLRQAGYSCAYLPRSQIEHFAGSTFSGERSAERQRYLDRSKRLFESKHLGYGVNHRDHKSNAATSWNIINRNLHPHIRQLGLLDPSRPELIFTHPGTAPFDYLYTVWETTRLPAEWSVYRDRYKLALTTSQWCTDVIREAGFENAHTVQLGVETDIFQPWGAASRLRDETTFLWFSRNQHRKGLDVMLRAWATFSARRADCRLVLMGQGIDGQLPWSPATRRQSGKFIISEHPEHSIAVYETVEPLTDEELAAIYRGVDFTVCSSRSEGFGFVVAESLAAGVPAIYGRFGATAEFALDGDLGFSGALSPADYSDKGFSGVGDWWEPDVDELVARLEQAAAMDASARRDLARRGANLIRNRFTWRNTAMALRTALATVQERKQTDILGTHSGGGNLKRKAIKAMRRGSKLLDAFATEVEDRGVRHAVTATTTFLRRRSGDAVRSVRRRVSGASAQAARLLPQKPLERRPGALFIGYAEAALGLAESFRGLLTSAREADLAFGVYPFRRGVESRRIGPFMADRYDTSHVYDVNVIEVAPDQVPVVFDTIDPRLHEGTYNVLRTYWELPTAPAEWSAYLRNIHEIWAPNDYVRTAFASIFSGPISVVQPCVEIPDINLPDRAELGLVDGRFYFLFTFDYYSFPARKNPLGVIAAFKAAFGGRDENVGLIIKSTGATDHYPNIRAGVHAAAAADPRIVVLDQNMDRTKVLGLINAADCYVSLHRAEGFGLGMVEAMSFGRPVIATDFSGSTDFIRPDTAFPVPYRLRTLRDGEYVWSAGQQWAEPDPSAAARLMREVFDRPDITAERARAGQAYVRARYSRAAVGNVVADRLADIAARRATETKPAS